MGLHPSPFPEDAGQRLLGNTAKFYHTKNLTTTHLVRKRASALKRGGQCLAIIGPYLQSYGLCDWNIADYPEIGPCVGLCGPPAQYLNL